MPCALVKAPKPLAFARWIVFFSTAMPASAQGPHCTDLALTAPCAVQHGANASSAEFAAA